MWPASAFRSDIIPPVYRSPRLRTIFLIFMAVHKNKEIPKLVIINDQPRGAHLN